MCGCNKGNGNQAARSHHTRIVPGTNRARAAQVQRARVNAAPNTSPAQLSAAKDETDRKRIERLRREAIRRALGR